MWEIAIQTDGNAKHCIYKGFHGNQRVDVTTGLQAKEAIGTVAVSILEAE